MNPIERKLRIARAQVVQSHAFFGTLLLKQNVVESSEVDAIATDGKNLYYNPAFIDECSMEDLHFVCAHAALHPALLHHTRRGNRDMGLWNRACDYVINPILVDAGLHAPDGVLLRPDLAGLTAEQAYARLLAEQPPPPPSDKGTEPNDSGDQGNDDSRTNGDSGQNQAQPNPPQQQPSDDGSDDGSGSDSGQGQGQGQGQPQQQQPVPSYGGCGAVLDAPNMDDHHQQQLEETEWKVAAAQAAMAGAGNMPGSLQAAIDELLEPRADWRDLLRRFMNQFDRSDYSWRSPNRRFVAQGLYLPQLHSEKLPPVLFIIDSSGSMSDEALRQAVSEVQCIVGELHPERLDVVVHDTAITSLETYEPGEDVDVQLRGRGGTAFAPVCKHVNDLDDEPCCIIWFTDLQPGDWNAAKAQAPDVPLIWIDYGDSTIEPPFGDEVVRMPA